MRKLKHLPLDQWSKADIEAFVKAFEPGDIFDETAGPGAHLAKGTRKMIITDYRRWLGFLNKYFPDDLSKLPAERITPDRVRAFIEHLSAEIRPTSVALTVYNLCYAARLIAPDGDWRWLAALKARLAARAVPKDRFESLIPPWQTLGFGIELMEDALSLPSNGHKQRELQFRDGFILALISLWPIRRRSFASLTVSHHLEFDADGVTILLHPEDTKAKRAESFRVDERLLPYLLRYLKKIRPRLLGRHDHDGLWASYRGRPLIAGRINDMVRARTFRRFGKAMSLHDFRRAAATFIAMDAPDKVGLIPGALQHVSQKESEQHYNLARSVEASRRFSAHLARTRAKLRPISRRHED